MNSLTPQLLAGLSAALDEAQARDEVKAIVLTGEGRAFCAGADLKFVRADVTGSGGSRGLLQRVLATMNRIAAFPKTGDRRAQRPRAGRRARTGAVLRPGHRGAQRVKLGDAHANYGLLPGGASVRHRA